MPTYVFKGYSNDLNKTVNNVVLGSRNAQSKDHLAKILEDEGLYGYEIFDSSTRYHADPYGLVRPEELALFCKQMSVLFFSHITLMEGMQVLSEQTENVHLKQALAEIHELMNKGFVFSESIGMYEHIFTGYLLNMIKIGEASGTLDQIFQRMANYYEKEARMRKKLRSAIAYPAILTALMTGIILLLILRVLPMFNNLLSNMGSQMPPVTQLILNVSMFINNILPFLVIVIVVVVAGMWYFLRTEKGMVWFDKAKITIPVGKFINARVVTSRFARSLAVLLKSGVQLLNAMEYTANLIDNRHLKGKFEDAFLRVKNGESLSEAIKDIGVFPPLFMKMIIIGQSTGHLDEMLDKSANIFDEEVDDSIERLTTMLEPILIIILSIIVGIILLSVMLPMLDIMSAIG